ncbi:MAG: GNAT family N-acetyltransferase [Ardenticatenaceae bacterium]|nr:GNAT family N-acetyltransferase [Ardenticatenaceae bacterium]MCB9444859.1 GNAT family N-acetyltransferase [Ardenticatenaceae bacterium]
MESMVIDSFETKTGIVVRVRPLLPEDAPYLVDIFEHMSADSRYRRFHQPVNHLSPERIWAEAESIAHTPEQVGFIAFADLPGDPGTPVGAVRCVCLGDGKAETAVSVRDDMQKQGIGSHLLSLLVKEARNHGVTKLLATIQSSNRSIIHILNRMPYAYTRKSIGPDTELELDITSFDPELFAKI